MQCVKLSLGTLKCLEDEVDFCVWSRGGELFAEVDLIDLLFLCGKKLSTGVRAGAHTIGQVWNDANGKTYAVFAVLNSLAVAQQNVPLAKFCGLSLGLLKRVALNELVPDNSGLTFKRTIVEEAVVLLIQKRKNESVGSDALEKKAKIASPAGSPMMNVDMLSSTARPLLNVGTASALASPTRKQLFNAPHSPSHQQSPLALSKHAFMGLFETFYDKIEEVSHLHSLLREQTRKSAVLLQTLQGSGAMIEGLVKAQVKESVAEFAGNVVSGLSERIDVLEKKLKDMSEQ